MASPPVGTILNDEFGNLTTPQSNSQPGKAPCILVGVTQSGTRTYQKFGDIVMHQSGKQPPDIEDIVWCIGSNTKVFAGTTLAVAITVQGAPVQIALDTAVADFLPQGVTIDLFGTDAIQVQHLVTHTAGWPDGMCYEKGCKPVLGDYTFTQMQDFLGNFKPTYAPGTLFHYSNQSFALLGTLVSQAYYGTAGSQPANWTTYAHWPTIVTETVIGPLGLTSTQVDYTPVADRMLQSWRLVDQGNPYDPAGPPNWVLDSASLAAGAVSSTLADMLTFLEAQITPSSTPIEDAILLTQARPIPSIPMGLGWQIGNDYFSKDGLVSCYTSFMIVDPTSAIGVVAVANADHCTGAIAEACALTLARLRQCGVDKVDFPQPPTAPACP
jgi:CubicO group peptidase (beta-lactamase class C family)